MSIINCSFLESRLPASWKKADIAQIPKKKTVNDVNIDLRSISLTVLGLNVSGDFKWNYHVSELVKKSSKRLYFLTQLKRAKVGCLELVPFFKSCVRF
jgi:hypothetical protein